MRVARRVASLVLRIRARTAAGWLAGVHRVATRPAPEAPALIRLPARWWTTAPRARVCRLGLRLELDRRDNLQRTLYGTGTQVQEVEVTAFDTWAAEHRVERLDLVQLDVEGAELAALQGMAGALARLRPRALVVEAKNRVLDRAGVGGDEVHRLLGRLGYEPAGQVLAWPTRSTARRQRPARRQ